VTILVQVAILAANFAAFVTGGAIVAVPQVPVQLPAIMGNLGLIMTDVAMQTAIGRECRHYSHS
jgi:hypothetical protein